VSKPAPENAPAHPSAFQQMTAMTAYVVFGALAAFGLLKVGFAKDTIGSLFGLLLVIGFVFSAWNYDYFSPAVGTLMGWIIFGVLVAYIFGR